jgi:hypothetical protein
LPLLNSILLPVRNGGQHGPFIGKEGLEPADYQALKISSRDSPSLGMVLGGPDINDLET